MNGHFFVGYESEGLLYDWDNQDSIVKTDKLPKHYNCFLKTHIEQYNKKQAMKERLRAKLEAKKNNPPQL